ncbi:HNH endonuclease [Salinigranum halophilum]|uniref:HNH endonuclease n=1 Tax=Salinigranum halophilum TaxID=2565931 RepID=UPI0010A8B476|nr:HNH endonuclease signature motif containing protein [Salinigranum halophilum]
MSGRRWERDEFLITLDLYLNESDYSMDADDSRIQEVAEVLDRTPDSVVFRLGNYRSLDTSVHQEGFSHGGNTCREIWEEYRGNPEELARDAESAWNRLKEGETGGAEDTNERGVETGERVRRHTIREGQSDFRSIVRERYEDECVVCDVSEPGILQAGHILSWSEFDELRGDPSNGILLCYNHHKAFDVGMFTFSPSYELVTRPQFEPTGEFLRRTLVERDGEEVEFPGEPPSSEYIQRHNDNLYWWPPETE